MFRNNFLKNQRFGGNDLKKNSPVSIGDTINTLKFTQRAKFIKNAPILNKQESVKTLKLKITDLLAEIEELREYKHSYDSLLEKSTPPNVLSENDIIEVKNEQYEKKINRLLRQIEIKDREYKDLENLN